MSEVHSILFDNKLYTPTTARAWLKEHNFKAIKPAHKTTDNLRYRIQDPSKYKSFITKHVSDGITFVIGFK
jgi:hypothetical protein